MTRCFTSGQSVVFASSVTGRRAAAAGPPDLRLLRVPRGPQRSARGAREGHHAGAARALGQN